MATITIRHFTDPACPFAFSAEPARLKLRWLYGEELEWHDRMVVLSRSPDDYMDRGFTPERQAGALRDLGRRYGMPIDACERPRMVATLPACRAVVAARLRAPGRQEALLRRLRVLGMAGELIDEPEVITRAAREAGVDPADLERWSAEDEVVEALEADAAAARAPSLAARALDHKLAAAGHDLRYTCPSLELTGPGGIKITVPGFQPVETYEVAIANLAPQLERRSPASGIEDILEWAGMPLATAEVAALLDDSADDARARLARVARIDPVGLDGYWSLSPEGVRAERPLGERVAG